MAESQDIFIKKGKVRASFERTTRHLVYGSVLSALLVLPVAAPHAVAQGGEEEVAVLEEVTVVGTRQLGRSAADLPVPVDVIKSQDLLRQGNTRMDAMLARLIPSYNVNQQAGSDEATFVRPANMRGLPPDSTLVLVNGKRRHRSSVIAFLAAGGTSRGAHGVDVSTIPAIALKRVEVLRDGASAQYGSDAISGVMNFQLKDAYQGGSFELKPGIYQEGDGFTYAAAGNIGLGSEKGWANLSLEYGNADETVRSYQRGDAKRLIEVGNTDVADPAQRWGQPFVRNDVKLFANYGAGLTDAVDLYGHANYASKEVEGGFYFRNPNTRGSVFSTDGGQTLLVGDLDGVGSGGECPRVAITDNVPDADARQAVFDDDNCFTFQEAQDNFPGRPGGFTPRFGANTVDQSALVGIKGTQWNPTFTWDLSASYGRHHSDFFIFNTVNASLGPDSPTSFNPGDYIQTDTNVNLDFTFPINDMLFLAAGAEYRTETFEIVQGDQASWEIGPLASQGFSSGSNGFNGFPDIAAGTWDRSNSAVYTEAEYNLMENWMLGAALRFENFDDFGSTTNFKLATNVGLSDHLKVRGSYSTGFRAPTPGQQNAFNVSTQFDLVLNDLVNNGTIPSTNPVAELVGGKPLDAEKSQNFTAGLVIELPDGNGNVTFDFFNIRVKDRLTLSQDFDLLTSLTEEQINTLEQGEVPYVRNLANFRYFINDFETTTNGVDIILTAPVGSGDLVLVQNITLTEVTDYNPETLNEGRIKELEGSLPEMRGSATLTQALSDDLNVLGRWNYFSSWWDDDDQHKYGSEFLLFDLEASYSLGNGLMASVGGQNVLNTYSDENPNLEENPNYPRGTGNKYSQFTPWGYSGAYWYGKLSYGF